MAGYSVTPLADLSRKARGFFTQTIPGAVASLWANTFTVFAKVLALLDFEHELRRRWLFEQMFASTAAQTWLQRHGFELGLTPNCGNCSFGTVTVAATAGLVVPADLPFLRADGARYTTQSVEIATGSSVTLYLQADEPGAGYDAAAGESLTIEPGANAPAGLGSEATVSGTGLTGGADAESVEAFRARVLARKREVPQGGSAADYRAWAHEALPTVRDVFVDSFSNDARSVWVQFTVTDQPNGIPNVGQVETVQAYLDDPARRPVTARVFVTAPNPVAVPILIQGLLPDTPDIRASLETEIGAVFIDRAQPGTPSADFRFSRSWISEAISRAIGENRHILVTPSADILFSSGNMPVPGTISYTD